MKNIFLTVGHGQKRFQNTGLGNASLYGVLTAHNGDSFSNIIA